MPADWRECPKKVPAARVPPRTHPIVRSFAGVDGYQITSAEGRKATGAKECLALVRRFKALDQQRKNCIDPRCKLRVSPVVGMRGMMEAVGGIEDRLRRRLDVCHLEHALLDAI